MSILHEKITDVEDEDFQTLIDELYHCVGWRRDDFKFRTIFLLLGAIHVQNSKCLTAAHLPAKEVLLTKVGKLRFGAVYNLCRDPLVSKGNHIESFDGKTVLSLLKTVGVVQKKLRQKQLGRNAARHEINTKIINQRRANGDL